MNPARIEAIINGMTGMPVTVTENVADYTFGVRIENTGDGSVDIPAVMVRLRKIKPSHQWFELDIGHSVIFENNPGALYIFRIPGPICFFQRPGRKPGVPGRLKTVGRFLEAQPDLLWA